MHAHAQPPLLQDLFVLGTSAQSFPQAPQLFTSVCRLRHAVGLFAGHGFVAELVRAPHVPFDRPVTAFEQPWHDKLQAVSQQTLSLQLPLLH